MNETLVPAENIELIASHTEGYANGTYSHTEGVREEPKEQIEEQPKDDMGFAMHMMQIRNQIAAAKSVRSDLETKKDTFTTDEIIRQHIASVVKGMTLEHIQTMNDDAVESVFTVLDPTSGESHKLELDLVIDDAQKQKEFKRDFLIYEKQTQIALENIDDTLAQMEEEFAKSQDEMDRVIKEYGGSLTGVIRKKLNDDVENMELSEENRAAKKVILDAFNDSFTLTRVVEQYKKYGTRTTFGDYKSDAQAVRWYGKYTKMLKKLALTTDLTRFNNLEIKCLPEKYHAHPNLFLFAIIKMMAHKCDIATKDNEGVFLSQFTVNVQSLFNDSFDTVEEKENFKASICEVLDLFYV